MNCLEVRKHLYPQPSQCVLTVETAHSMEHLRRCEACQRYFADQAQWSRWLKEKIGTDSAPASLVGSISRQVEQTQEALRRSTVHWSFMLKVAAAVLLLALVLVGWAFYRVSSQKMFQALCEDHTHYLDANSQIPSSSPNVLESWFREKTDFGVRIPKLDSADLVGGRLCVLRQRKAALVFYRKEGRVISLFQFNARGITLSALEQAEIDGILLWRASFQGYSLAAFENRGVIYAMVSDLRESTLLELASAAQVQSRGY